MMAHGEVAAPIRVLLIEDQATDAELEIHELRRAGLRVEHCVVSSERAFVEALRSFAPDVILSDFSMPHFDGMAALELARVHAARIPFLFVSGTIGEEYAIRALKNGATDYVLKTNLVRLPAAVERALADAAERRARLRVERLSASEKDLYQMIARGAPLAQVLEALCRSVEAIGDEGMLCTILLVDEDGARLRIGAAPGLPAAYNDAIDGMAIGPAAGSCGTAAYRGTPVIVSDIASDPLWRDWRALAAEHGLAACWSVPVLSQDGTVLGSFANYFRAPRAPEPDEVELIERASGLAQIAIAHEHAGRSIREANQRLALALEGSGRALFDWNLRDGTVYLSEHWAAIVGGEPQVQRLHFDALAALVHPDDREAQRRRIGDALAGRSADYRVEHRVMTRDGAYTWIESHGKVVQRAPDGTALRLTGTNADISAEVAQRARFARLSRVRAMLGATNAAIVRMRERQPLFEELCRIAVTDGGFALARVIAHGTEDRAYLAATTEADPALVQRMLEDYNRDRESAATLIAQVLRGGQAVVSNDVQSDARVLDRAALTAEGNYALALLPIEVGQRVAAVLVLRAREPGVFDEQELGLLQEIVGSAAFALELIDKQGRLDYLALYDALTGLPNRRLLLDRLAQALEAARRAREPLALVVFDLERFRGLNEALGEKAGDDALRELARRLRARIGDERRIGRLAGDRFAVVHPRIAGPADVVRAMGEDGDEVLGVPVALGGREIRLVAKGGIAVFPDDGADAEALLRNAEASLQRAKDTGERYLFYAPQINARVAEQVELEQQLRNAVERGELALHYQPKVEIATRRIVGLEALMRWNGPDGKPVPPARFVPLLEVTGLIFAAGKQALATAAATWRAWQAQGLEPPRIAVNVSALQLRSTRFVQDLRAALGDTADCGVDLEITESLLMENVEASISKLRRARALGLGIALDDFGTGYSSLAYLSRLPIDTVKIDRSFVRNMADNADDTTIVTTIISLAQAMRYTVVAEGVETEEQARLLQLLRCDQMQGWLFSAAKPREEIEAMLRAQASP